MQKHWMAIAMIGCVTVAIGCDSDLGFKDTSGVKLPPIQTDAVRLVETEPSGFEKIGEIKVVADDNSGYSDVREVAIAKAKRIAAENGTDTVVVTTDKVQGSRARGYVKARIYGDAGRVR